MKKILFFGKNRRQTGRSRCSPCRLLLRRTHPKRYLSCCCSPGRPLWKLPARSSLTHRLLENTGAAEERLLDHLAVGIEFKVDRYRIGRVLFGGGRKCGQSEMWFGDKKDSFELPGGGHLQPLRQRSQAPSLHEPVYPSASLSGERNDARGVDLAPVGIARRQRADDPGHESRQIR